MIHLHSSPPKGVLYENDQLPDGLIAQLVEHCSGVTYNGSWVRIPFWPEFFSGFKNFNFTTA